MRIPLLKDTTSLSLFAVLSNRLHNMLWESLRNDHLEVVVVCLTLASLILKRPPPNALLVFSRNFGLEWNALAGITIFQQ